MIYITRKTHFNAAHKLYNPAWDEAKNREVFGKCANPNYHGHNFDLYVTIKGDPDPDTGFVMDSRKLGQIIHKQVIEQVDHKNLNVDVPFMKDIIPSTEHFVKAIWEQLEPHIRGGKLHAIRLHETEKFYVDYYGD